MKIEIIIDDVSMIATLDDNPSAKEFYEHIKENNLTLKLEEYGGFEYVGPLGFSLTRNDESINTKPGDIILYNGNQISITYMKNNLFILKKETSSEKFLTRDSSSSIMSPSRAGYGNLLIIHKELYFDRIEH